MGGVKMKAPTKIEKDNLPLDVRIAFNQGVDLYKCVSNYELGIISREDFIKQIREVKSRFELTFDVYPNRPGVDL